MLSFFSKSIQRVTNAIQKPNYFSIKELLPNKTTHTTLIARYNPKSFPNPVTLDPRWHEPLKIVHWVTQEGPLKRFIIARHKNRLNNRPDHDGIISLIVEGRVGFTKLLINNFLTPALQCEVLVNDLSNISPRVGLTTTCCEEEEKARLQHFLNEVEKFIGFDADSKKIIDALCNPENKKGELPEGINLPRQTPPQGEPQAIVVSNSNFCKEVPFYQNYRIYDAKYHAIIPDELPDIHQAIFAKEVDLVKKLLLSNPHFVKQLDPWGVSAIDLASQLGPFEVFEVCYQSLQSISSANWLEEINMRKLEALYHNWQLTGYNMIAYYSSQPIPAEAFFNKARTTRIELMAQPKLSQRSALHKACLDGDLKHVQDIIEQQPERLNEMDCLGFTPLMLSLAHGHVNIAAWLIKQGDVLHSTSTIDPDGSKAFLRLIDHATTPESVELLLHHYVDEKAFHDRLITAVIQNDLKMARYLLYYLHDLPSFKSLSALEWVMKLAPQFGTDMLQVFLKAFQHLLLAIPYDQAVQQLIKDYDERLTIAQLNNYGFVDIPPAVRDLLQKHNEAVEKITYHRVNLPKITDCRWNEEKRAIEMRLSNSKMHLTSVFKHVSTLEPKEIEAIHRLFFNAFDLAKDNNETNQLRYLHQALLPNNINQSFVNLVYDGDEIISFFTFEFELGRDASYVHRQTKAPLDFYVYHAKLGANKPQYAGLNLINLGFSSMISFRNLKNNNEPMYCFIKAIPPGYGLCILPKHLSFFPKYHFGPNFVNYIGRLINDPIFDKTIPAKLKVKASRQATHKNLELDYFEHVMGTDVKDAMAIIIPVHTDTVNKYKNLLALNGFNDSIMQQLDTCWSELFDSYHDHKLICRI